jgi:hypothetical protein
MLRVRSCREREIPDVEIILCGRAETLPIGRSCQVLAGPAKAVTSGEAQPVRPTSLERKNRLSVAAMIGCSRHPIDGSVWPRGNPLSPPPTPPTDVCAVICM